MLTVRPLKRIAEVPQAAWDALALPSASPFVEWTWLSCLEDAGCVGDDPARGDEPTGWSPMHLVVHDGDRLVAAAPAYAKTNSEGEFVFDWSWADVAARIGVTYYPKIVLAVPFTPATGDRVLVLPGEDRARMVAAIAEALRTWTGRTRGAISGAHVLFPGEAEAAHWTEAGFLARTGIQYHWHNDGYASVDDFLARFTSKRRNQLRREMAQPAKDGVTIETLAPGALDAATSKTMYELYLTTVDKFVYGRRYLTPRFFDLVRERFADRLAWVVAKKDGAIVAGAFNVKKNDVLYGRYWGTFTDLPFLHFNVCYYHGIAQCIAEGLRTFEPGAGGEHKKVRGFAPSLTHSAHWLEDPRLRQIIASFLGREREAVARYVADETGGAKFG